MAQDYTNKRVFVLMDTVGAGVGPSQSATTFLDLEDDLVGAWQIVFVAGTAVTLRVEGRLSDDANCPWSDLTGAVTADQLDLNVGVCPFMRVNITIAGSADAEILVFLTE